jgi:hypothetical protein
MAITKATKPPEYVLLDAAEFALHAIDNVLNERHPDHINTLKSAHTKLKAGIAGMKSGTV